MFTDCSQDCYLQFEYLLNKREQALTVITRGLTGLHNTRSILYKILYLSTIMKKMFI